MQTERVRLTAMAARRRLTRRCGVPKLGAHREKSTICSKDAIFGTPQVKPAERFRGELRCSRTGAVDALVAGGSELWLVYPFGRNPLGATRDGGLGTAGPEDLFAS